MLRLLLSALSGGLFGAGLLIAGMTDTTKVQGFLDVLGAWDPTLIFVLGGAVVTMAGAWQLTRILRRPLAGVAFPAPPARDLDRGLIVGSILFGIGWGLIGLRPGPVLAALGFGERSVYIFAVAMAVGMALAPRAALWLDKPRAQR